MTFTGIKTRINPTPVTSVVVDPEVDAKLTCIAVLDESDNFVNSVMDDKWASFRANWPLRRFIFLNPWRFCNNTLVSYRGIYIPPAFASDPRAFQYEVRRDENACPSDWYALSGLDDPAVDVKVALLFVDISGSMIMDTVIASARLWVDNMVSRGYRYKSVQNGNEDWIEPFNTSINDFGVL